MIFINTRRASFYFYRIERIMVCNIVKSTSEFQKFINNKSRTGKKKKKKRFHLAVNFVTDCREVYRTLFRS